MQTNGYVYDIEADNLYLQTNNIWYIYCKSLDCSRELELWPFRDGYDDAQTKLLEWHLSFGDKPLVVSFNGLGVVSKNRRSDGTVCEVVRYHTKRHITMQEISKEAYSEEICYTPFRSSID